MWRVELDTIAIQSCGREDCACFCAFFAKVSRCYSATRNTVDSTTTAAGSTTTRLSTSCFSSLITGKKKYFFFYLFQLFIIHFWIYALSSMLNVVWPSSLRSYNAASCSSCFQCTNSDVHQEWCGRATLIIIIKPIAPIVGYRSLLFNSISFCFVLFEYSYWI